MVACHGHTKTGRSQQLSTMKVTGLQDQGSSGPEDREMHRKFKSMNWKALLRKCLWEKHMFNSLTFRVPSSKALHEGLQLSWAAFCSIIE